jgi:hypothetical protein
METIKFRTHIFCSFSETLFFGRGSKVGQAKGKFNLSSQVSVEAAARVHWMDTAFEVISLSSTHDQCQADARSTGSTSKNMHLVNHSNTVKAAVLFSDSWPGSCLVTVFERDYNRFGTSVVDLGGYYLESSPRDCTNGGDKTNVRSNA